MKNKGFTLVELITTFALFIVVLTVVVNIILSIKNIYYNYDFKTRLLINQGNMLQEFYKKFYTGNLQSYTYNSGEYSFVFKNPAETITLKVTDKSIKFGKYIYNFDEGTIPGTLSVEEITISESSESPDFLVIKIPLTNNLYKTQDFGLNLIYRYNF